MHHTPVIKKLLVSSLSLLVCFSAHAQKATYYTTDKLLHNYQTKTTTLRATQQLYTGYEYALNYYTKDTTFVKYFYNGRMESQKSYGTNKRLTVDWRYYYHGLKNDSICMEQVGYSDQSGDTSSYLIHYVDKNGIKWSRQRAYHYTYSNKKPTLSYINTTRFFTKKEAKNFQGNEYRSDAAYDSLGYHANSAQTGMFIEYYENGKVKTKGRAGAYEYCIAHRGLAPSYPSVGRLGTWTFYNGDGVKYREEIYDNNGVITENRNYYLSGKLQSQSGYKKLFSLFQLPSREGLTIGRYDTCKNVQTSWYEDGKLMSESFTTPRGEIIQHGYLANGKPSYFMATTAANKPFAVHKKWDANGNVAEYMNYSVEWIDTICYRAVNGKITSLNMRNMDFLQRRWCEVP